MLSKNVQKLLMCVVLAMSFLSPITVNAAPPSDQMYPQVAIDCGADVSEPSVKSGYVVGTATISCASTHGYLLIRVSINRSGGVYGPYLEKTCYNTWTCSVTGDPAKDISHGVLPYYSGYSWQAAASGYWEGGNQAGAVSSYKPL
ncbi:MAG: hypothetical protein PHQ40_21900 [Anaerolineaceae bacterium]|nr:hypothetical protein [Anaerolineaceae bacterium]